MEAKLLGQIQLVAAALILWFDRAVFSMPDGQGIAIVLAAVVFVVMGLHHLGEEKKKHR